LVNPFLHEGGKHGKGGGKRLGGGTPKRLGELGGKPRARKKKNMALLCQRAGKKEEKTLRKEGGAYS